MEAVTVQAGAEVTHKYSVGMADKNNGLYW